MSKFSLPAPSRIPPSQWFATVGAVITASKRSPCADGGRVWRAQCRPPAVSGIESLPASGGFLVLANHYNGPGIWVGLEAALLAKAIGDVRPDAPLRGVGVAAYQNFRLLGILSIPDAWTQALFTRFYRVYDIVPMPRATEHPSARSSALRNLLAALRSGAIVLMFPEGGDVENFTMRQLRPGVGDLLRLVSRSSVPVVPAATYEDGGHFHLRFGSALDVPRDAESAAIEDAVGHAIAGMVPERLRGPYGG